MSVCGKKYTLLALTAALLAGCPSPKRPAGTGDVGVLEVYAQVPEGPRRLPPSRRVRLLRPQDFAFRFRADGTGPRWVRIELEQRGVRTVLLEEQMATPSDQYLDYTLRLDERAADEVTLTVVVQAPHMLSAVSDFPILLVGAERPFWEVPTSTKAR